MEHLDCSHIGKITLANGKTFFDCGRKDPPLPKVKIYACPMCKSAYLKKSEACMCCDSDEEPEYELWEANNRLFDQFPETFLYLCISCKNSKESGEKRSDCPHFYDSCNSCRDAYEPCTWSLQEELNYWRPANE